MIIVMIVIAQYKQNGVAVSWWWRWFYCCCYVMLFCFVLLGGICVSVILYIFESFPFAEDFFFLLVCMSECTHVSLNVLLCMSEISALSAAVLCMFNFFCWFCQKNKMGSNSREWCSFPDLRFLKAMMLVFGGGGWRKLQKRVEGERNVWRCIWIWFFIYNIVCIIIMLCCFYFTAGIFFMQFPF